MMRAIIKATTATKPKPNSKRIAALKAHQTMHREALERWIRKLKFAAAKVNKHHAKLAYYTKAIAKEKGES